MSNFSGLNIGLSSLYAQQRGLQVTGHNIANANTDGYSRQRVDLSANHGPVSPAVHSRWSGAGNGVTVDGTDRVRDEFLEGRALVEHGRDAALRAVNGVLREVETTFAEPGDIGLQSQMSDFFNGWDDVANNPDDLAARTQLLERAETLATGLNRAAAGLTGLRDVSVQQLDALTEEVNATATRVAELNQAVSVATRSGLSPNDLADQRDRLVSQLADLVGATRQVDQDGMVTVLVAGRPLVSGPDTLELELSGTDPAQLTWVADGVTASIVGGQVGGLLSSVNEILPRHAARLDEIAAALADTVNTVHVDGVDQAGNAGQPLFVSASGPLSATSIRVGLSDPTQLAAAETGSPAGSRNGANAMRLAELAGATGSSDTLYRAYIVDLGVEVQTSRRRVDIQAQMTAQVDAAREAVSGVNLDEEMTNMITFQRAYEAAARFVTSVDQMLDTLINRTGLVGR